MSEPVFHAISTGSSPKRTLNVSSKLSLRSMVASSSAAVLQTRTRTCKTVLTHRLFFFFHQGTNTDKFWSLLNSGCC
jgi:hypothetical protein